MGLSSAPVSSPTVSSNPSAVVVADFNGDGIADVAVGGGNRAGIMLGLGDGTFENWGDMATGLPGLRGGLYSCDCDGDGDVDLLASNNPDGPDVKLLRGRGDGTFESPVTYAAIVGASQLLFTDLNHDGRPDVVQIHWDGG